MKPPKILGVLKREFTKEQEESMIHPLSATCLDCDWQDDITKAETDWCGDYDEFRGEKIPTKIFPKCGGGVEIN